MKAKLQRIDLSFDVETLIETNKLFKDAPMVLEMNENADPGEVMLPCIQEFFEKVFSKNGPFWGMYSDLSFASTPINSEHICFIEGRMYYLRNIEQRFLFRPGPMEEYRIKEGVLVSEKRVSLENIILLLSMPFEIARQQAGIIELGFLANEAVKDFLDYANAADEYYARCQKDISDPYLVAKESLDRAVEAMRYANIAVLCSNLKVKVRSTDATLKCASKELKDMCEKRDYDSIKRDFGYYSLSPYDISKPRFREDVSVLRKLGFPEAPLEKPMIWRENAKHVCAKYLDVRRMAYQKIGHETSLKEDIFFLKTDELASAGREKLALERLQEQKSYTITEPPSRIVVYFGGIYTTAQASEQPAGLPKKLAKKPRQENALIGKSVSSHRIVRGIAIHVDKMSDYERFKEGGIIVSKNLSPNLTLLYPKAVAVVSETGSAMAHSAIIAREMKIPCVVDADVSQIKEGQRIEVDGQSGRIRTLD